MRDNCFIDTNILIYCYTSDEPNKKQKAISVASQDHAVISTQVLSELSNILKRKFNISWTEIKDVITELKEGFDIYVNSPETIESAVHIADRYKYSFYDSLILASAISANCKTLYSEDMHDGQVIENSLTIKNPFK